MPLFTVTYHDEVGEISKATWEAKRAELMFYDHDRSVTYRPEVPIEPFKYTDRKWRNARLRTRR